jgi:hypothetical protein
MKTKILGAVAGCCLAFSLYAQTDTPASKGYRNFPIVLTLQFHAFTLPFHDMKSNFSNIGIGVGTEVSLNGRPNWVQQVNAVWYCNKALGNGLWFYTQNAWRPSIASNAFAEVKAGAGYRYAFRPAISFKQANGKWVSVGRRGKWMLTLPIGVSAGYDDFSSRTYFSPFVSYQFLIVKGYNKSIPVVPETFIQAGIRMHMH